MMTGPDYSPSCTSPTDQLTMSPAMPSDTDYLNPGLATSTGPPLCHACSQPIYDPFILQVQGHTWHSDCLRCSVCQTSLSHMCYSANAQLYCQDDFFRLFGAACSSCRRIISPSEVVRRAHDNVYHLDCFRCSTCRCELRTGDQFYLNEDGLLCCSRDYIKDNEQDCTDQSSQQNEETNQVIKEFQENLLLEYFRENSKPKRDTLEKIASDLGMDFSAVRQWFRLRRVAERNEGGNCSNSKDTETNRVHPPAGGYPLPIVNPALSPFRNPESSQQVVNELLSSSPMKKHILDQSYLRALDELLSADLLSSAPTKKHIFDQSYLKALDELWSNDFVPPNVNLEPDHLLNGDVIAELRPTHQSGHNHVSSCQRGEVSPATSAITWVS